MRNSFKKKKNIRSKSKSENTKDRQEIHVQESSESYGVTMIQEIQKVSRIDMRDACKKIKGARGASRGYRNHMLQEHQVLLQEREKLKAPMEF